ncbi:MAG: molybdenum cofactor guanylyltransferase [Pirellulales bacterium]|nr:molybdenum cofactor guanylyltransferase [Pirellulales bacterium]
MAPRYNEMHELRPDFISTFESSPPTVRTGAIILCGGKSTRMGSDKATLPFGPERMLQRVVRLVAQVVDPAKIVVAAAADQSLPPLPADVTVTIDERPERGPLEGLAVGFRALQDRADAIYASSCDVPLLIPAFVERMFSLLGDYDIAVPCEGGFRHPLAAVYGPGALTHLEKLLAADRLRVQFLLDEVRTRQVSAEELLAVDPQLSTLRNLNSLEDYSSALVAAGF